MYCFKKKKKKKKKCIVRRSYTLSETGGLGLGQTTATVGGTRCMLNTYRYVQTIKGRICITSSPLALAIRRAACVASHTAHAEACLSVVQVCLSATGPTAMAKPPRRDCKLRCGLRPTPAAWPTNYIASHKSMSCDGPCRF